VTRLERRLATGAVLATLAFTTAFLFAGSSRRGATAAYLLVLGALALIALAGRLSGLAPARTESIFPRRRPPSQRLPALRRRYRPTDLEMLEGRLLVAGRNAADFHTRLRPMLREIAAARLQRRHGVVLDHDPVARTLLGDELWEAVRPDRAAPADRSAPGPGLAAIEPLIARLEELG
jgi:broad specificity phosphatase PhoE